MVAGGHFPLSGMTDAMLIQIWNRGLLLDAKSLGLGVGGGERAKHLVFTPEGPGIVERLRVGVSLGSIKQPWVGVLATPPTSCVALDKVASLL